MNKNSPLIKDFYNFPLNNFQKFIFLKYLFSLFLRKSIRNLYELAVKPSPLHHTDEFKKCIKRVQVPICVCKYKIIHLNVPQNKLKRGAEKIAINKSTQCITLFTVPTKIKNCALFSENKAHQFREMRHSSSKFLYATN